jgi:DNA-binding transcriptional regulator YhcF (GntR family)
MEGWIKLHRKILEWEWYTDAPVRILFEHLLLTANYEDKKWRGMTIKRGQKVTSIGHLAEETGLSVIQVRTALEKLEKTKNVTSRATNKFTLVTIENYSLYQSYNDYTTSNVTNKRQTNDNNIRNIKNKEERIYTSFGENQLESLYDN